MSDNDEGLDGTNLRQLAVEGIGLGGRVWSARLAVSYFGQTSQSTPAPKRALLNKTAGLRVLLQDPAGQSTELALPGKKSANFRSARLLQATLSATNPIGSSSLNIGGMGNYTPFKADDGTTMAALAFSRTCWEEQTSPELQAPAFELVEGRIPVWVRIAQGDKLGGPLNLRWNDKEKWPRCLGLPSMGAPFVRLPIAWKKSGKDDVSCVLFELTPDGIEFEGDIADPTGDGVLRLIFRLTRPNEKDWALQLAGGEEKHITPLRKLLAKTANAFRAAATADQPAPLSVEIDSSRPLPELSWPLSTATGSPCLPATQEKAEIDWKITVAPTSARITLLGDAVDGGTLKTSATLPAAPLQLWGSQRVAGSGMTWNVASTTRDADNAVQPRIDVNWTPGDRRVSLSDGKSLTLTADTDTLVAGARARYRAAGAADWRDTKDIFLAVRNGWLQLKLKTTEEVQKPQAASTPPGPVATGLDFQIDRNSPTVANRRLQITGARDARVAAVVGDERADGYESALRESRLIIDAAVGRCRGFLFAANASPSADDLLPQLGTGPLSLRDVPLQFGQGGLLSFECEKGLRDSEPARKLKLLDYADAWLWRDDRNLPVVSAVPMTRAGVAAGLPSAMRGTVPYRFKQKTNVILSGIDAFPAVEADIELYQGKENETPWQDMPFAALTLPGMEFYPNGATFSNWKSALRFDLPPLDELFAFTEMPKRGPKPKQEASDGGYVTALSREKLPLLWDQAVDRLRRADTQGRIAVPKDAGKDVSIANLFYPETWETSFVLEPTHALDGKYTIGRFQLDGDSYLGDRALEGLTKQIAFRESQDAETSGPVIDIRGFAPAALHLPEVTTGGQKPAWQNGHWQDARGMRVMAAASQNGIVRHIEIADAKRTYNKYALLTLAAPITITGGTTKVSFWCRDLPLNVKSTKFEDPAGLERDTGPEPTAFDRDRLGLSLYEWRFFEAEALPPLPFDIGFGPFRFRPLRLREASFASDYTCSGFKVAGSLSVFGHEVPEKGRPFGFDDAYATGNLVQLELPASLAVGDAAWTRLAMRPAKPAQPASTTLDVDKDNRSLSFTIERVSIQLGKDDKRQTGHAALQLNLTLDGRTAGGAPRFSSAELSGRLFGQRVWLTKGSVEATAGALKATFTNSAAESVASRLWIAGATLNWDSEGATLVLSGGIVVRARDGGVTAGTLDLLCWEWHQTEDKALYILGASVPAENVAVVADHDSGLVNVMTAANAAANEAAPIELSNIEPIRGLSFEKSMVSLSVAFAAPNTEEPAWPKLAIASGCLLAEIKNGGADQRVLNGPISQFTVKATGSSDATWAGSVEIDLALTDQANAIGWPAFSVPDSAGLKTANGSLTSIEETRWTGGSPLIHSVTTSLTGQPVALSALARTQTREQVILKHPFAFNLPVLHRVTRDAHELRWRTLDHVVIADLRAEADNDAGADYSFAARYRTTSPHSDFQRVKKAGVVQRALALAGFPTRPVLSKLGPKVQPQIVFYGAGPSIVRSSGDLDQGYMLAMPWLVCTAKDEAQRLHFSQSGGMGAARAWRTTDIDFFAGAPMLIERQPPLPVSRGDGTAGGLREALGNVGDAIALEPVEQAFIEPKDKPADPGYDGDIPIDRVADAPMWLRSLLAINAIWMSYNGKEALDRDIGESVASLCTVERWEDTHRYREQVRISLPTDGDARVPGETRYDAPVAIVLGRDTSVAMPLTGLVRAGTPVTVSLMLALRSRLIARSFNLVKMPVALVLPTAGSLPLLTSIDLARDDDSNIGVPATADDRAYASPSLGWPAKPYEKTSPEALSVSLGDDTPFQDRGETNDPDVRRFGSGFAGRSAAFSFAGDAQGQESDRVYVTLGRKTLFERQGQEGLRTPPVRHLAASQAKSRVPLLGEIEDAFEVVGIKQTSLAGIVSPHVERASIGLRPGALTAEFDAVVAATHKAGFDESFARFGMPGDHGPVVARQTRAPRAPALPRVTREFVKSHGRRTYVGLDHRLPQHDDYVRPFLLESGAANVFRDNFGDGSPDGDVTVTIRIPPDKVWLSADWRGSLDLEITIPSPPPGGLALHLAKSGLFANAQTRAVLVLGNASFAFGDAEYRNTDERQGWLRLSLPVLAAAEVAKLLRAADGNMRATLLLQFGPRSPEAAEPPLPYVFALRGDAKSSPLPEPRVALALALGLTPQRGPIVQVARRTLIFADPSYDRQLSGPGDLRTRLVDTAKWRFAVDRLVYGPDTPIYFACGEIDPKSDCFKDAPEDATLGLTWIPLQQAGGGRSPQPVIVNAWNATKTSHPIKTSTAYGFALDQLRFESGEAVSFAEGDRLSLSVIIGSNAVTLTIDVGITEYPVIAPPPAAFSLVYFGNAATSAWPALHASSPLPTRIEFPDLLNDLARGTIRRNALFVWPQTDGGDGPTAASLLKYDRSGGAQLINTGADVFLTP